MSYEGYVQVLCENGHYHTFDACEYSDGALVLCDCGAKYVWWNNVDLTNGSFDENDERIDGYIELEEKEIKKCPTCGHVERITYKIPKGKV